MYDVFLSLHLKVKVVEDLISSGTVNHTFWANKCKGTFS